MISLVSLAVVVGIAAAGDVTYFSKGYDAASIAQLKAHGEGKWTAWMNRDTPNNLGEYEQVAEQHRYDGAPGQTPKMLCSSPVAMVVRSVKGYDMKKINKCTMMFKTDPAYGYRCDNYEQIYSEATKQMVQYSHECRDICSKTGLERSGYACGRCPDVEVKYFCKGSQADFDAYMNTAKRDLEAFKVWEKRNMKRALEQEEMEKKEVASDEESIESLLKRLMKDL